MLALRQYDCPANVTYVEPGSITFVYDSIYDHNRKVELQGTSGHIVENPLEDFLDAGLVLAVSNRNPEWRYAINPAAVASVVPRYGADGVTVHFANPGSTPTVSVVEYQGITAK